MLLALLVKQVVRTEAVIAWDQPCRVAIPPLHPTP